MDAILLTIYWTNQAVRINVELITNVLMNFPRRTQDVLPLEGVRFRERTRIVQRDFDLQVTEIRTLVTLGNAQLSGVRRRRLTKFCR